MQLVWKNKENVWQGLILGPSDQLFYSENKSDISGSDKSTLQIKQTIGGGQTIERTLADIEGPQATKIWNGFLGASNTIRGDV